MENCEISKKSLLKKSDFTDTKKRKRVTFCSTVKVFIDEIHSCQNKDIVDLPLNCIEVSIIDKSSEDSVDVSKNDDCNATDFLVHKVVYENNIEHDDDIDTDVLSEEADECPVLFETNAEDEGLHFVVHKVTEHEDDLIQQELDLEDNNTSGNFSAEMECDSDIIGKLSKLSLENILAHDKIIAFIDQNTLGLSSLLKSHINATECISPHTEGSIKDVEKTSISACLKGSELVLSPPLQELGLDKIVKAQTDNILCEFDISPLNSILETDSDSDVSSEGTMIMMTSEESEKNELHIRESLQKYESLKKDKVQNTIDLSDTNKGTSEISDKLYEQCCNASNNNDNEGDLISVPVSENCISSSDSLKQIKSANLDSENNSKSIDGPNSSKIYGVYVPPCKDGLLISEAKHAEASLTLMKNSCYWDNSLKSVQIPKDVREWKIFSSPEKKVTSDSNVICSNTLKEGMTNSHEKKETFYKSDELENFALASKERVQRIRKRYFDKAQKRTAGSPVRGIRPRFGSTAEILQIVQKQNQHSLISYNNRSHVSWPCNSAITNSYAQRRRHSNDVFPCQSLSCEYSSQSSSSCVSDDSNCDHDSVSSCPSVFFHERGVPEGASPPQSLSEDSIESCTDNANSSIVYFSMKV